MKTTVYTVTNLEEPEYGVIYASSNINDVLKKFCSDDSIVNYSKDYDLNDNEIDEIRNSRDDFRNGKTKELIFLQCLVQRLEVDCLVEKRSYEDLLTSQEKDQLSNFFDSLVEGE